MTAEDFGKIAAAIKTYFPKSDVMPTKEAVKLWFDMLGDLSYEEALFALKKHVATCKFAPTIAEIRENARSLAESEGLNEMEAWSLVRIAIGNSLYHSEEEYAKLPPLVQKAVGVPGQLRIWAMDEMESEPVTSSNFIKCYRVVCAREKEKGQLPEAMRKLIEKACSSTAIEEKRRKAIESKAEEEEPERKGEAVPFPERHMEWLGRFKEGTE